MARMIRKEAAKTDIVTGTIKEIREDSLVVATREMNRVTMLDKDGNPLKNDKGEERKKTVWTDKDVIVQNDLGFSADEYKVGNAVTAIGEYSARRNVLTADAVISKHSGLYVQPYKNANGADMEMQVLAGLVKFAGYNSEVNPQTQEHYQNQSGKDRKPHFDLCISVKDESGKWVSHIVKYYDTKNNPNQIESCKKAFEGYDKEKNSAFCTVIVSPGEEKVRTRQLDGGAEMNYVRCEHLGNSIPDVTIVNYVRDKSRQNSNEEATQEQGDNGFENQSILAQDEYDEMGDFQ